MDNGQIGSGLNVVQLAMTLKDLEFKLGRGLAQTLRRNMADASAKVATKCKDPAIRYLTHAQVPDKYANMLKYEC